MKIINIGKIISWSWIVLFGLELIASTVSSENLTKAQTNIESAKIAPIENDMTKKIKTAEFKRLLQTVAGGWNEGNARRLFRGRCSLHRAARQTSLRRKKGVV